MSTIQSEIDNEIPSNWVKNRQQAKGYLIARYGTLNDASVKNGS
jgi:hypothetical protein